MNRRTLLLSAPLAALAAALPATPAMAIEEPPFTVEQAYEGFELRRYAPMLVVETAADSRNAAFRRLFNYIAGSNLAQQKIEMTAPVVMNPPTSAGERIEMTAPVLTQRDGAGPETMQFVLPTRFTLETAPRPTDAQLRLRELPEQWLAVRRYSGTWSDANFGEHAAALRAAVQAAGLAATGEPRFAAYNGPLTLWFLRRNEVMLPVEKPRR